jgi:hypothetical protein
MTVLSDASCAEVGSTPAVHYRRLSIEVRFLIQEWQAASGSTTIDSGAAVSICDQVQQPQDHQRSVAMRRREETRTAFAKFEATRPS